MKKISKFINTLRVKHNQKILDKMQKTRSNLASRRVQLNLLISFLSEQQVDKDREYLYQKQQELIRNQYEISCIDIHSQYLIAVNAKLQSKI